MINQRRWVCTNPLCRNTVNDQFNFVEPGRRNTNITDMMILDAFRDYTLTASKIASLFGVSDTYAITLFSRYVDMPKRALTEAICIDEVHINVDSSCKYALVIQDFITGEPIDLLPSRREDVTEPYFASIPIKQRLNVKYVVTDMYRPYIGFVDKYFPNAVSIVDSFHVVKYINSHLYNYINKLIRKYRDRDELRHDQLEQEFKRKIEFIPSVEYYLLKKYKWLILKNNEDINYSAKPFYNFKLRRYVTLGDIERMIFNFEPELKKLRDLKETYIRFNKTHGGNHKEACIKLRYIIDDYRASEYDMFHTIADSLEYHYDSIINSFILIQRKLKDGDHVSRLSNGPMEALNHIVKDIKRNGRGYRNFSHLRNRFLFSQRKNSAILGVPKTMDEISVNTGKKRGPYRKKEKK